MHEANERIHAPRVSDESRAGMGTTMTAALVGEDEVTIAHVGDSRAYLLRDGEFERADRRPLARRGARRARASSPPRRPRSTRSARSSRARSGPRRTSSRHADLAARDGDVFLLCSDGLTTMVDERTIAEIAARRARSLEDAGDALIDAANDAGGRDNITVILVPRRGRRGAERDGDVGGDRRAAHGRARRASRPPPRARTALDAADASDGRPPRDRASTRAPLAPTRPGAATRARRAPPPARRRRAGRRSRSSASSSSRSARRPRRAAAVYFIGADDQGFVTVYRGVP